MKKIKSIIIDDDAIEQNILETHLKRLSHIENVVTLPNPIDAVSYIHSEDIDILFLNVSMPDINAIEFIKSTGICTKTILISSNSECAVAAYEVGVPDYLLKPYTFERLLKAISRVIDTGNRQQYRIEEEYIFFKSGRDLLRFYLQKIEYFEAYGSFTKVFHDGKMTTLSESISSIQEKMPAPLFIRVHKSYLVAKDKIVGISAKNILMDKVKIPLGISYREAVEKSLGN